MSDRRDETRVGLGSPARARNRSSTPRQNGEAGLAPVSYIINIGRRRSLDELMAAARAELNINPTITVYTFIGGVERRRAANPWAGLRVGFRGISDGLAKLNEGLWRSAQQFSALNSAAHPLRLIPGGLEESPP